MDTDNGYHLTVCGLVRRCGELHSEIEGLRDQLDAKMMELDQLTVAVRILKPDIDPGDLPERPAPPPSAAFRGEVGRFLISTLRAAAGPRTTTQMAEAVMQARGLNLGDRVLWKLIRVRTGHSLANLRKKGFAASRKFGGGAELEWTVTERGAGGEPTGGWRNGST